MRKLLLLLLLATPTMAQVSVSLSPVPHMQFLNNSGIPLANGCIFTYAAGTTTPAATYIDSFGVSTNSNPILLDAGGFANIWLPNAAFKFKVVSAGGVNCASGVTQWTVDNISGVLGLLNLNNTFTGSNTFTQPITDTATTNQLVFGTAGNQTTLNAPAPAGNVTINLPNTADTLVGRATTDTLTNKTITNPVLTFNSIPNTNGPATYINLTNNVLGTGTNLLTAITNGNQGATAPTNAVQGIVGVCVANCTTSGTGTIQASGTVSCTYDGATTAGDYVIPSVTSPGSCHDSGVSANTPSASPPTSGQLMGIVLSTNAGIGSYPTDLFGAGIKLPASTTFFPNVVYSTPSASTNSSIGATNMATAGAAGNTYRMTGFLMQSALGNTCSTNTTILVQVTYTDPASGGANTANFGVTITIINNGVLGPLQSTGAATTQTIRAKAGTQISYQVTYTIGTCVTGPSFQFFPILEQLTAN
jgi:hypothetical protein